MFSNKLFIYFREAQTVSSSLIQIIYENNKNTFFFPSEKDYGALYSSLNPVTLASRCWGNVTLLYIFVFWTKRKFHHSKYLTKKQWDFMLSHWMFLYLLSLQKLMIFSFLFLKLQRANPEQSAFWKFKEWKLHESD